jgi:hypothetical protein
MFGRCAATAEWYGELEAFADYNCHVLLSGPLAAWQTNQQTSFTKVLKF